MAVNVAKEVAAMRGMTVPDLRRKYVEVFGEECDARLTGEATICPFLRQELVI